MAVTTTPVDGGEIDGFSEGLHGELLRPEDPNYDETRAIWNGMIDKRPALIVRSMGVSDVIAAVTFAREQDLPLAVRGGGHNIAGNAVCDDGLMLDLSAMRSVHVGAGDAARDQLNDRRRGAHTRRWIRLAHPQIRHDRG
jgi:hypothetical protein